MERKEREGGEKEGRAQREGVREGEGGEGREYQCTVS